MARKVIIDCDPGIDDAVALTLALFDPPTDARHSHGADGLGNINLPVPELHHQHRAEKIIHDEIKAAPEDVTILALGPLTNVARAFRRDPTLAGQVGQIIIAGGAVNQIGNVTPSSEFNIYCDPVAAREIFRLPITKTLAPLDVTREVEFTLDLIDELPDESTRAGGLLRQLLPFLFRSHRQQLGLESIHLQDTMALLLLTDPDLFETRPMAGDVETSGELTIGATVFDRRVTTQWRENMEVANGINVAGIRQRLGQLLRNAGDAS